MEKFFENVKQHPYLYGAGLIIGLILLYFLFGSGSATPTGPTDAQIAAQNFATQTQGATELAVAQAAQQAQQYAIQQQTQQNQDTINGQVAIANMLAQLQGNANAQSAAVSEAAINAGVQQTSLNAQVHEFDTLINSGIPEASLVGAGQGSGYQITGLGTGGFDFGVVHSPTPNQYIAAGYSPEDAQRLAGAPSALSMPLSSGGGTPMISAHPGTGTAIDNGMGPSPGTPPPPFIDILRPQPGTQPPPPFIDILRPQPGTP